MSSKHVYLFGIGSPEWQRRTGHTISALGVPIPMRPKGPKRPRHKRKRRRPPKR